jgi:hypothetical protein
LNIDANTLYVDSSANKVGIGTNSPSAKLDITGGHIFLDNAYGLFIGDGNTGLIGRGSADTDSYVGIRVNGGADKITVKSTGNVGIATTSPSEKLQVDGNIALNGELKLVTAIRHSNSGAQVIDNDNDTYFILNDPEGSNRIKIGDSGDRTTEIRNDTIKFATANGTEKARVDSSGNLLVGTTNTNPVGNNVVGHVLLGGSMVQHSITGNTVMKTNQTTDGDIIQFRKSGTPVGSIKSRSGVVTTIILDPRSGQGAGLTGAGSGGDTARHITATTETGAEVNAKVSLGKSNFLFKDI